MIREMKTLNNINLLSPSCWKELFVLLGFAMVPLWEQYVYVISLFCRQVTRFLGEEGQPLLRPELQENC